MGSIDFDFLTLDSLDFWDLFQLNAAHKKDKEEPLSSLKLPIRLLGAVYIPSKDL